MRTKHMFLALTMAAACGVEGPVLYSDDAALGGSSSGTGGDVVGTGGVAIGSGGAVIATGGLALGSGGAVLATGGSVIGSGGAVLGSGGMALGSGGAVLATGGIAVGSGGAIGGSSAGRGGAIGGSSAGRGGAIATGGVVIGSGGAVLATGGIGSGSGGAIGGRGGSGGNPDASDRCSGFTNTDDCTKANCMPIEGRQDGTSEDRTFFQCIRGSCTGALTAAYPEGQPGNCYVFSSGCIPDDWTGIGGSYCPTSILKPTITSLKVYQDCMPGPASDRLDVTFDVKYDNAGQTRPGLAIIKSASLTTDTGSIAIVAAPSDSGVVPADKTVTVTHKKQPNSWAGGACVCGASASVTLDVTWETGGQIGRQTVTGSLAGSPACAY